MLILLVDDDREEFELFCDALRTFNPLVKCIHALDGRQGINVLKQGMDKLPDYVFLDINMPVMNGKECLITIKEEPRLKDIPVIMYSTSSDTKEVEMFKGLGATDFIVKPASFSRLVSIIRQTLGV